MSAIMAFLSFWPLDLDQMALTSSPVLRYGMADRSG